MVNTRLDFATGSRLATGWGRCALCAFKSKLIAILVSRVIEETTYINILIVPIFCPDLLGNTSIYVQTWGGEHIFWDTKYTFQRSWCYPRCIVHQGLGEWFRRLWPRTGAGWHHNRGSRRSWASRLVPGYCIGRCLDRGFMQSGKSWGTCHRSSWGYHISTWDAGQTLCHGIRNPLHNGIDDARRDWQFLVGRASRIRWTWRPTAIAEVDEYGWAEGEGPAGWAALGGFTVRTGSPVRSRFLGGWLLAATWTARFEGARARNERRSDMFGKLWQGKKPKTELAESQL